MSNDIIKDFNELWNLENNFIETIEHHPQLQYADTDSLCRHSLINIEETLQYNNKVKEYSIENLFDKVEGNIEIIGKDNFVKHLTKEYLTPSVSKNLKLENKPITYIMKHKVKKRIFKIKVNGDEVDITEDHSLMVLRNKKLVEIKPGEVKKDDRLYKIQRKTKVY
jgi:intein/homing endonuclease